MKKKILIASIMIVAALNPASANRRADPPAPLGHCYHWLKEAGNGYLTYKYKYAQQKNGEFSFFTDGAGGAVAGPGIYCAKTPMDSYDYGDRVVRIELVDDIVLYDELNHHQYCGKDGKLYRTEECNKKPWDIKYYYAASDKDWYVIRNPQAIKMWTANDDQLVQDLIAIKADGGAAIDAHMDATLARISAEIRGMGKRTFFNGNGRLSFAELIKDDNKMNSIPPLSVISMAIGDSSGKVDKGTRSRIIRQQFNRALLDTELDLGDFADVLKRDANLKNELVEALLAIRGEEVGKTNLAVFISLLDRYVDASQLRSDFVRDLWERAFTNLGPLATLVQNPVGKDSVFRKEFAAALPPVAQLMKQIDDKKAQKNLPAIIRLVNDYTDASAGANYIEYTLEAFNRILASAGARQAEETFAKINNPSLRKDEAIQSVFASMSRESFKGRDPFATAALLEKVGNAIPAALRKTYRDQIVELPLLVTDRATYILLDEFKNGQFKLPAMFSRDEYLVKLVERSINERSAGKAASKNLTNTYRFIQQGLNSYWFDTYRAAKTDKEKADVAQQAASFFRHLAESLKGTNSDHYSYASLQLAGTFMGMGKTYDHPLEFILAAESSDPSLAKLVDRVVPSAKDASVIEFLVSRGDDVRAQQLLTKTIAHVNGIVPNLLRTAEFKYVQEMEKKLWDNVVRSKRYQGSRGRVPSTVCHMGKVIASEKAFFDSKFPAESARLNQTVTQILATDICKDK